MKGKNVSVSFMLLGIVFCVCLILGNLLAVKQIEFGKINLTCGILIFPVSYIINDCIAEVWGFKKARLVIWTGFVMNLFFVAMCALADWIPGAPYWTMDEGFHQIFGLAPRVAAASFVAFLVGSFSNAYIMSRMKVASAGRHFTLRAVVSTLVGESLDSMIFFPIAFYGVLPLSTIFTLIWTQAVLKTLYEVVILPVTIMVVKWVKRHEKIDVFDSKDIDYSWWKILKLD